MKKGLFTAILLLLAVALLAGCCAPTGGVGASTLRPDETIAPDVTAGPIVEPSQLISKSDAEALVGNALKDDTDSKPEATGLTTNGMKFCFYASAGNKTSDRFMQVTLYQKGLVIESKQPPNPNSPSARFTALKLALRPIASSTPNPTPTNTMATPVPAPTVSVMPTPIIPTPVQGLGDDAFFAKPGLHILYKGYYIVIAVGNPDDPANQEILRKAGEKAVENLKKVIEK